MQRDRGLLSRFPGKGEELSRIEAIGPVVAVLSGRVTAPPDGGGRTDRLYAPMERHTRANTSTLRKRCSAYRRTKKNRSRPEWVEPVVSMEC